jgi:hypothetical protein
MNETKRRVLLVEVEMPKGRWSSSEVERWLNGRIGDRFGQVTVWGTLDGVDAAWRKLNQLVRETEQGASLNDRLHSGYKAGSFFRDMFPTSFWKWKRIGRDHPDTPAERQMMAGR